MADVHVLSNIGAREIDNSTVFLELIILCEVDLVSVDQLVDLLLDKVIL